MIKVGILGTGFGQTHLEWYRNVEGFQAVSIFGRNPEKLRQIADKYKIRTTTEINEVIEDPSIDLIDVCLPTELHAEWVIKALENGKHVFCETPVTYSSDEADAIRRASEKYGKNVFVSMFILFSAPHKLAAELVEKSECGKLISIRSYNKTSARWGDLGLYKNITNFHNHMMDYVIRLAGMPKAVTAAGIDYGAKSVVTSILTYDQLYAVMESSSAMPECNPFEIGFELVCTEGVIRCDAVYGDYTNEVFSVTCNGKPREAWDVTEVDDYVEVVKHIKHCLQNNKKSDRIDIVNAIDSVRLKEMIVKSMREATAPDKLA
ncbi:MAG: Gfo/Idh/MocA family oxidoreductase [Defluviitaleaceae bacterium]|nr:Gfo/Idh/MocA family oxidoreductase [Defluviitaleaceae bacterium]